MKRILLIAAVFLLSACAGTTVHIIEHGIKTEKVSELEEQLAALGYAVERSDALVPDSFADVSIATNPSVTDPAVLAPIITTLSNMGWEDPKKYQFAQGNHFYHNNHIGVYLRNPDQRLMPPIMGSRKCGAFSATLEYGLSGEAIFEYEVVNRDDEVLQSNVFKGRYAAADDKLTLSIPSLINQTFVIQSDRVDTHVGLRRADYIEFPLKELIGEDRLCRLDAVYE